MLSQVYIQCHVCCLTISSPIYNAIMYLIDFWHKRHFTSIPLFFCFFHPSISLSLCLSQSATRCLLLSGTPALSRPIELYTQISALDRTFKMSQMTFAIRYCNAVKVSCSSTSTLKYKYFLKAICTCTV